MFDSRPRLRVEGRAVFPASRPRPGGAAVTTWFVFDEDRLPAVTSEQSRFPMRHQLTPRVRYSNPDDPLHAICYDEALVGEMVASAGLTIEHAEHGAWTGEPGRVMQDLFVLRRGEGRTALRDRAGDARGSLRAGVTAARRPVRRVRRRLGTRPR